jgi:hypothetical protein
MDQDKPAIVSMYVVWSFTILFLLQCITSCFTGLVWLITMLPLYTSLYILQRIGKQWFYFTVSDYSLDIVKRFLIVCHLNRWEIASKWTIRLIIGSGVREIASKWTIRLIIRSGVREIASKWTIRLIIRSGVREIASKWTIRLIIRSGVRWRACKWTIRLIIRFGGRGIDSKWTIRVIIRSDVRGIAKRFLIVCHLNRLHI